MNAAAIMPAWTEAVDLRHRGGQRPLRRRPPQARLREPTGSDELAVTGVDTAAALAWLQALIDGADAHELSPSERDALLAAQHRALWGDRILCTLDCEACQARFDLSFELSALQEQLASEASDPQGVAAATPPPTQARRVRDEQLQRDWQLSCAADEMLAAQSGSQLGRSLLASLAYGDLRGLDDAEIDQHPTLAEAEIAAAATRLEQLAPLIDVDLDADCPECACAHRLRFDIQSWVLQRVLDERPKLLNELHLLAAGYRWTFAEISALPRGLRRELADRLQAGSTWSPAAF